jgi:phage/plasmid-like protein (TIGR03299 family)
MNAVVNNVGSPEWIRSVDLSFEVERVPVLFSIGGNGTERLMDASNLAEFKNRVVLRRADNKEGLGIVSANSYKLVQPAAVFDFYQGFTQAGGMQLVAGGNFKGGQRIWAQAELDNPIILPGNDLIFPQFLLSTSYNGDTGTVGTFTTRRVFCENTLNMALSQGDAEDGYNITGFSIPHHREFDVREAQKHVEELMVAAKLFEVAAHKMTQVGMGADATREFLIKVAGSYGADGQLTAQSKFKIAQMDDLYRTGPGSDAASAQGTLWGVLNAVTRFIDHEAPSRSDHVGRTYSAWFGDGKTTKVKALHLALQLTAE